MLPILYLTLILPLRFKKSRILTIIKGLKWTIFRNSPTVIVQLPMTSLWEILVFVTKIQKIDTTRSHGIEIKDSLVPWRELRLLNELRLGGLLKQMDLKVTARDVKGVIRDNPAVTLYQLGLIKNESFRYY